MTTGTATDLSHEVAAAHGAVTLAAGEEMSVSFSSGGLAFAAKGQPDALGRVEARLNLHRQQVTLTGARPSPWRVEVTDSADLHTRLRALRAGSRRVRWRVEDVGVFAAAAIWTYMTMPLVVTQAERAVRLADRNGLRRLRLTLPAALSGHSATQTLHIGPDGSIRRHDYTATAFGSWARAAQTVAGYQRFDGVLVGTERRVTPRLGPALPGPTLVWIHIDAVRLI